MPTPEARLAACRDCLRVVLGALVGVLVICLVVYTARSSWCRRCWNQIRGDDAVATSGKKDPPCRQLPSASPSKPPPPSSPPPRHVDASKETSHMPVKPIF